MTPFRNNNLLFYFLDEINENDQHDKSVVHNNAITSQTIHVKPFEVEENRRNSV